MTRKPPIHLRAGVAGYHMGEAFRVDADGNEIPGTRRTAWGWQKNLVLDTGLDRIGNNNNYVNGCQVGEGNTPPDDADTALQDLVATTTTTVGDPTRATNTSPPYALIRYIYRFGVGAAAGNLAEVGITMDGSSDLFSRSLIRDGGGSPIIIAILPDEVLDVTYELRWYPATVDVTGVCEISEDEHDYIVRAANATTLVGAGGTGGFASGWGAGTSLEFARYGMHNVRGRASYDGDIGTITGNPAGTTSATLGGGTAHGYDSGSFTRTYTLNFGLAQGNHGSGIRCLRYAIGPTCWQLQFDPPVMKTSDDQFAFDVRISWDRA